jgi:NitT/TauT family transport system substrate-binding protein
MVALLLLGACSGCGAGASLEGVRIGANRWVGFDLLAMAEDLGWFEEEGFHVEIVDLGTTSDIRAAFERGYVDGMATTLMEVIQSRSEADRAPVAVLITDYSDGADVVVARRDITAVAGLAGARIAVEPPLGIYILSQMLAAAEMTLNDVEIVWVSQAEMPGLAWAGQIDAAVTFPPASIELTHDLGYNTLFSSAEIPGEVLDVVSFSEQFTRDHPEAVRAILRVWDRSLRYLSEHHREAVAAIAAREGLEAVEVEEALGGVQWLSLSQQSGLLANGTAAVICPRVAEALLQAGVITETDTAPGCASSEFIIDVLEAGP